MHRQKGGKLSTGEVDALVYETKYKGIRMTNVYADITSDGAVAEGNLKTEGKLKLIDILCSFSFTDTNEMKKIKIKPAVHFHLFHRGTDKEKAEHKKLKAEKRAERKEMKRQEREVKRQERKEEKKI